MDDTLYDEIDYYKSGFLIVSQKIATDYSLKKEDVFEILWEIFNDEDRKNTFNILAEKLVLKFDAKYIDQLIMVFRNHKPDISLPSESSKILTELKNNYKLGMVTDGWLPGQEYKVKALGIENIFDFIVYTEKLGTQFWKPSPKGFEILTEELKVKPEECVYVADNLEKDFIAPNKLGFKTIRIIRKKRIHFGKAYEAIAEAKYEINSISDLPDLLRKIDAL